MPPSCLCRGHDKLALSPAEVSCPLFCFRISVIPTGVADFFFRAAVGRAGHEAEGPWQPFSAALIAEMVPEIRLYRFFSPPHSPFTSDGFTTRS
jgi:hypothetical protein